MVANGLQEVDKADDVARCWCSGYVKWAQREITPRWSARELWSAKTDTRIFRCPDCGAFYPLVYYQAHD